MKRQVNPTCVLVLAFATIGIGGCDKLSELTGKEAEPAAEEPEEAKPEEEAEKVDEEAAKKVAEAEGKAKEVETKLGEKEAELAALKAQIDAQKAAQETAAAANPEAAKVLEAGAITEATEVAQAGQLEAGQKGPVTVANVKLEAQPAFVDQSRKGFKLTADLTVNEEKGGGVFTKLSCVSGEEVFVDVVSIGTEFGPFGEMKTGATQTFEGFAFMSAGLEADPARCQLAFSYGSRDFSVELSQSCFDGKEVKDGACAEKVEAKPQGAGAMAPFAFKFQFKEAPDFNNQPASKKGPQRRALDLSFATRFNEPLQDTPSLSVKTACKVADKTWVEVSPIFPQVKPFTFSNGEAILARHNQFFLNSLPAEPESCDVTVFHEKNFGEPATLVSSVCWRPGQVTDGTCAPKPPPATPEPMSADTITIDEIGFIWTEDFRDSSKVMLNVSMGATMAKAVTNQVQLMAQAKCDGKEDREQFIGSSLKLIEPGETVAVTLTSFIDEPFNKPAKKCDIVIRGRDFSSDQTIDFVNVCLKGEDAKIGKCATPKKKVKKAPGAEPEPEPEPEPETDPRKSRIILRAGGK